MHDCRHYSVTPSVLSIPLYQRLPERIDTEDLTNKELASESKMTHSRGKEGEDATLILLQQEKEELLVENKHLSELVQSTSKVNKFL